MEEVLQYLSLTEKPGVDFELAKEVFSCFEPFKRKPEDYARSTLSFEGCKVAVDRLFASIWANTEHIPAHDENDLTYESECISYTKC